MKNIRIAYALIAALFVMNQSMAQTAQSNAMTAKNFPNKTIHIVVPFTAGGTTDMLARNIGQRMTEAWGQAVVIDNKPGAAGWLGISAMAKMPADGHTIGLTISNIIYAKSLYATLPFNIEKDFAPVSIISRSPIALIVASNSKVNNMKEFVEMVRSNPGKHSYASFGQGTSAHVSGETLKLNEKLDMVHVPYKGAAPIVTDLLGGQVTSAFIDTGTVLPLLRAGKVKVLALSGVRRLESEPNLPTFLEQGYKGFEPVGFFQVLAPAGTPPDILNKLSEIIAKTIQTPKLKAQLIDLGQEPVGSTPQELAAAIRVDGAIFDDLIRRSKITVEQN